MFIPKESDKEWMRNCLAMLKDGGIWATTWALYKKSGNTLSVVLRIPCQANIEENVNRVRIVCEAIGVTFKDEEEEKTGKKVHETKEV